MSVVLLVLYPQPEDEEEFESEYLHEHLPLMRSLLDDAHRLRTSLVRRSPDVRSPYSRTAEIHFPTRDHFREFVRSGKSEVGRASAMRISTGGPPVFLVCDPQAEEGT